MSPVENFFEYPSFIRAGINIPPTAIMVMPLPPVNAVNSVQTRTATMASPPGIQPSSAPESLIRRVEELLSAKIKPVKINSGIAIRPGALARRFISMMTIDILASATRLNKRTAAPAIIEYRGEPLMSAIRKKRISVIVRIASILSHSPVFH